MFLSESQKYLFEVHCTDLIGKSEKISKVEQF